MNTITTSIAMTFQCTLNVNIFAFSTQTTCTLHFIFVWSLLLNYWYASKCFWKNIVYLVSSYYSFLLCIWFASTAFCTFCCCTLLSFILRCWPLLLSSCSYCLFHSLFLSSFMFLFLFLSIQPPFLFTKQVIIILSRHCFVWTVFAICSR